MRDDGFIDVSVILGSAVYALLYRGRVQYIGISKNPLKRIPHHYPAKDGKRHYANGALAGFLFDQIMILPCKFTELEATEIKMIKKYHPEFNVNHREKIKVDISHIVEQLLIDKGPAAVRITRRI